MTKTERVAKAIYESHKFKRSWEHPRTQEIWRAVCMMEASAVMATMMTHEEMVAELRRVDYRVSSPIDQKTCPHTDQVGSGNLGSDGSGSSTWYCRDCGASGHREWPATQPQKVWPFSGSRGVV